MPSASLPSTFRIGGEIEINRLGFGAMRITGPGIWGDPAEPAEVRRTLARLTELGVNFIDTADSYGPNVSENLIREVLHPYTGILVATKAGLRRGGPNQWSPDGTPAYLRQQAEGSRKRLGVEQIDLWHLHRVDPQTSRAAQFQAVRSLIDDGVIRFAGLSEVSVGDIEEASRYFPVATVQNQYNVGDRQHEAVLEACERKGIGFIPFFPLAAGQLARKGSILDKVGSAHGASPSQIALAWMLQRSPVMLPIPGTSKVSHLEENVAAAEIHLSESDFRSIGESAAVH